MKIIAFIAAILSAATVATLAFTTVPSIQKQAADNAAAVEQNTEDISSLDNSFDGLNTRIETLESKEIYIHYCYLTYSTNYIIFTIIDNSEILDISTLTNYISATGSYGSNEFNRIIYTTSGDIGLRAYWSREEYTFITNWTQNITTYKLF